MPSIVRNGVSIDYDVQGQGPCLVMTHSFLCDRSMFRHQVAALQAHFRVINIDLRGHGASGDASAPFSVYDLVDDVLAVLDAEGERSAVWAGLSMGGFLSMRAALRHPERVRALVLMDTDAGTESRFKAFKYGALLFGLRLMGVKPLLSALTPIFLGPTTRAQRPAVVAEIEGKFMAMRIPSVANGIQAITSRDAIAAELGAIRCPTLVLVGAEDEPTPPSQSEDIARRIPGAQLQIIPGSGHLAALETPEPVTAALLRFVQGLPAA